MNYLKYKWNKFYFIFKIILFFQNKNIKYVWWDIPGDCNFGLASHWPFVNLGKSPNTVFQSAVRLSLQTVCFQQISDSHSSNKYCSVNPFFVKRQHNFPCSLQSVQLPPMQVIATWLFLNQLRNNKATH